jgi:hypothetical protein
MGRIRQRPTPDARQAGEHERGRVAKTRPLRVKRLRHACYGVACQFQVVFEPFVMSWVSQTSPCRADWLVAGSGVAPP